MNDVLVWPYRAHHVIGLHEITASMHGRYSGSAKASRKLHVQDVHVLMHEYCHSLFLALVISGSDLEIVQGIAKYDGARLALRPWELKRHLSLRRNSSSSVLR